MLLVTGCRFMFHGFVEINFQRWGYMRKAFLPDFSLGKPSRNLQIIPENSWMQCC